MKMSSPLLRRWRAKLDAVNIPWGKIKPGWYVLVFLLLYSLIITVALQRSNRELRRLHTVSTMSNDEPVQRNDVVVAAQGLWFPIPGAGVPQNENFLPGAPRSYRQGINQGFNFYDMDAGIPISYGTPVVASASGTLERVDSVHNELSRSAWQQLIATVGQEGANEEQLDLLRGRQLWLRTDNNYLLRYAHLSRVEPGLSVGDRVYRGQVIAYVGNSGTNAGVEGSRAGVRLHYEVWTPEGNFFGHDLNPEEVRSQAASNLFIGP